jgi:hypothetical protein
VEAGSDMFAEGVEHLDLAVNSLGHIYVLDTKRGIVKIFHEK